MQSLIRSIVGLCRRPIVGRASSAPSHWCPSAYARKTLLLFARTLDFIDLDLRSRPLTIQNKTLSSTPISCAEDKNMKQVATHLNPLTVDGFWYPRIIENSTHRDGAIYKNTVLKEDFFDVDLTDHNETRFEPMMLSKATGPCLRNVDFCMMHFPRPMLQFFSLTLAKCHVSTGSVEIYGYIATRDDMDWMCNYIFNRRRDDPVIIHQGSPIPMTGPKRGIEISCPVLIEFDMRIKNGEQEKDDQQLIDGAFGCYDHSTYSPLKHRVYGNCGIVDMSLTYVEDAVEATIEIVISEVQGDFTLCLSSFIKVVDDCEEIQLFRGTVDQPMGFRRFVVAVTWDTVMLLKFNLASHDVERCCSFRAQLHGYARQNVDLDVASVSLKVTWSTLQIL